MKRVFLREINSTNEYAKARRGLGENLLVIAERQTGGRGTKGRSFSSQKGGVYLSLLTFYKDFPALNAFQIMQGAAAAVCETLVCFGLKPKIKWANDVYVNGKKICGILIENALKGKCIASSVVGIGLNVSNELPKELVDIATTIYKETGKEIAVEEVIETLVRFLEEKNIHEKYAQYLGWLNEEVTLVIGEKETRAKLLSVDEAGGLWAEVDGEKKRFVAAEVSLRIARD
ncbi:MAG: biotin--[acetyl-CoA-carboxylase] ligase [Clostridia bacterium]|nr:biotin--[acetyl-CoA-carboxylase] ligase [Clostridia bacterium]